MTVSTKIGFGTKVKGEIVVLGEKDGQLGTHRVETSMAGRILLLLNYVPREFLEKASCVGIAGIIVPSMHNRDFEYFRKSGDFSLLVLTKFGKLGITAELAAKLAKLDGKAGELDGEGKKLEA